MRLRTDGLSTRRVGEETIVLDLQSSRYLTVTGVGVRILEELESGRDVTIDELVTVLTEEYDVEPRIARRDVTAFETRLAETGLLAS